MRSRFPLFAQICCAILFVLAALMIPSSANSQELRGKIIGRIKDSNGPAVPGATVTITDESRAAETTLTANSDGLLDPPY